MLGIFVWTLVGENLSDRAPLRPSRASGEREGGRAARSVSVEWLRSGCDDLDGTDHAVGLVTGKVADESVFAGLVEGDGGLAGG